METKTYLSLLCTSFELLILVTNSDDLGISNAQTEVGSSHESRALREGLTRLGRFPPPFPCLPAIKV